MPWECVALGADADPWARQATAMVPRVRRSSACSCSAHLAQGQELPSGCIDTCPSLAPLGINKTPVSGEAATASCSINQTLLNAPWGRAVQAQPSDTTFRRWHRLPGRSPRGFRVILPARHHQCCRTDPCHPTAESPQAAQQAGLVKPPITNLHRTQGYGQKHRSLRHGPHHGTAASLCSVPAG